MSDEFCQYAFHFLTGFMPLVYKWIMSIFQVTPALMLLMFVFVPLFLYMYQINWIMSIFQVDPSTDAANVCLCATFSVYVSD